MGIGHGCVAIDLPDHAAATGHFCSEVWICDRLVILQPGAPFAAEGHWTARNINRSTFGSAAIKKGLESDGQRLKLDPSGRYVDRPCEGIRRSSDLGRSVNQGCFLSERNHCRLRSGKIIFSESPMNDKIGLQQVARIVRLRLQELIAE